MNHCFMIGQSRLITTGTRKTTRPLPVRLTISHNNSKPLSQSPLATSKYYNYYTEVHPTFQKREIEEPETRLSLSIWFHPTDEPRPSKQASKTEKTRPGQTHDDPPPPLSHRTHGAPHGSIERIILSNTVSPADPLLPPATLPLPPHRPSSQASPPLSCCQQLLVVSLSICPFWGEREKKKRRRTRSGASRSSVLCASEQQEPRGSWRGRGGGNAACRTRDKTHRCDAAAVAKRAHEHASPACIYVVCCCCCRCCCCCSTNPMPAGQPALRHEIKSAPNEKE